METRKIISKWLIATVAIGLTIGGCKKDNNTETTTTTTSSSTASEAQVSANDNEEADFVSSDVTNMADMASSGATSGSFKMEGMYASGCGTLSHTLTKDANSTDSILTITIDFGTSPCMCLDMRYRKGKIIVTQKGRVFNLLLATAGSKRTVTFDGYYVGKTDTTMHKVEGTHTVTFNGKDNTGYSWTIQGENMKVTKQNGKFHTWNSTRTRTWSNGYDTPMNWHDDVYVINGTASASNSNGNSYTATIKDLTRDMSCTKNHFTKGTVTVTRGDKTATLNYGDGTCDDKVSITIDGKTYPIELH